jgi:predicted dehydrogenase
LDANDTFVSMVEFEHGAVGTITSTRFGTGYRNRLDLKIFCDKGAVRINFDDPVSEGNNYEIARDIDSKDMYWEKIATSSTPSNFERFIKSIKTGQNDQPDFKRGAEIQKVLDSCFESAKTNTWVNI